jgi:hypothetical protein
VAKTTSVVLLAVMVAGGSLMSGCGDELRRGAAGAGGSGGGPVVPPGDGGMPPPGTGGGGMPPGAGGAGGTSSPPVNAWEGTSWIRQQGSGSEFTVSADVRWTLASSAGGVDHYQPSGTAHYEFSGGLCTVVISPSSGPIAPTDGELVIDRRTTPATYTMRGETHWTAQGGCAGETPSPPGPTGGLWADNHGAFEGDVIGGGIRRIPEFHTWELRRAGATFPPPAPGACLGTAATQWMTTASISDLAGASVTWTLMSTSGCVDTYEPAGTAMAPPPSGLCVAFAYTPATTPVGSGDGVLQIDRSTNPPGFVLRGATTWNGTATCTAANGAVSTFGPPVGGDWADAQGTFTGDRFAGGLTTTETSSVFAWSLTRLP